jgi:SlyX protein
MQGLAAMQALFSWESFMSDVAKRIDDLETRVAHQEKIIGELNDVITAQWRKMEALEFQLRRLGEELQTMDSGAGAVDKPPPHY